MIEEQRALKNRYILQILYNFYKLFIVKEIVIRNENL
jgi:hypothetical protein